MTVARALRKSAADIGVIAEDRHGNAIAIIAIHAAIAYADALCIAYGGFKSTEGEHERAVDALKQALGNRIDSKQASRLLSIVKAKDTASYQGVYYRVAEAQQLVRKLEAFGEWAEKMYDQRP
ncbi:MAG: hypothetical protein KY466_13305 [Gemmatimonadetes bacterium]|nr:hypothetical protein [Gemmatimonadota bacterium]